MVVQPYSLIVFPQKDLLLLQGGHHQTLGQLQEGVVPHWVDLQTQSKVLLKGHEIRLKTSFNSFSLALPVPIEFEKVCEGSVCLRFGGMHCIKKKTFGHLLRKLQVLVSL